MQPSEPSAADLSRGGRGQHAIVGVDHVSFSVADLDGSLDFYVRLLGCEPIPRPEMEFRGAWLRAGAQQVHLLETSGDARPGSGNRGARLPDGRNSHVAFVVDDVAKLERFLVAHGVVTMNGPGGGRRLFICDPDGHTLELTEVG